MAQATGTNISFLDRLYKNKVIMDTYYNVGACSYLSSLIYKKDIVQVQYYHVDSRFSSWLLAFTSLVRGIVGKLTKFLALA